MTMQYVKSSDGTPIAYECWGQGPALFLVHGGGGSRHEWAEAGYIRRLRSQFTLITPDLRGHGDSGQPTDPADYTTALYCDDILAVADDCSVQKFSIWGMSFGGKVCRYLAVHSTRVERLALLSTPMGPGVVGQRRQEAVDFQAHWSPILTALRQGQLERGALSPEDQAAFKRLNIPAMLGWVPAMLDWPEVAPADFLCPTLWVVGTEDPHAMESLNHYQEELPGSRVQVEILEGLGHEQVFSEIDLVLPTLLAFTLP